MWKLYAILSALFAALTAIFAKIGVKDINSNLATAIRTTVILIITWGIVLFGSHISEVKDIPRHTWLFLVLSGIATGRRRVKGCTYRQTERSVDHLPVVPSAQGTSKPESHPRCGTHHLRKYRDAHQIRDF